MRILVALLTLLAVPPLSAQTPAERPHGERFFVEGAMLGVYLDTLGPAIEAWGGSAEFGLRLWESGTRPGRTMSARLRVDRFSGDASYSHALSFLVAPELSTRRIALEVPMGLTVVSASSRTAALTVGISVPIGLGSRLSFVPRGVGHLAFEGGVPAMVTVVGLGVRWRFGGGG